MPKEAREIPRKYPTTIRFDEDDLPQLKGWRVGGKYKLTLEVEQISMSKGDEFGPMEDKPGKPKTSASFKVLSVRPLGADVGGAKRPEMLGDALKKRI